MFRAPLSTFPFAIVAAFFSGAAALTLEVVWSKALVVPLGNSSDATALVLAGFMLGIALGSSLGARLGTPRALRFYAGLELMLALFALFVPAALNRITGLGVPEVLAGPWMGFALRFTASMALIVLPCLVMGATLPLLLAAPSEASPTPATVGWLYGANTLGATLASVVTGFYGIANWGVAGCSRRSAVLSATAAALGLVASARQSMGRREASCDTSATTDGGAASVAFAEAASHAGQLASPEVDRAMSRASESSGVVLRRQAVRATFLGGFVLLSAEVFWARILTFVFGHDTYAFATLLGIVLLGLALGGLAFPYVAKHDPRRVAGWAMAGVAISLLGSFYAASWLVIGMGRDPFALGERFVGSGSLSVEMLREFAYTPILALLPCLFSGLAYPATIAMWSSREGSASRATGSIGLANGIGAATGATLTSLGLVAWLGIQGVLSAVALTSATTAAWLLWHDESRESPLDHRRPSPLRTKNGLVGFLAPILVLILIAITPKDLPRRMLLSVVGPRHQRLLHYEEARTATVAVIRNEIHGERQLLVNAVNEVTTRLVHDQSFKLLGQLGPLLHPQPKRAVMICLGAGLAAGSALSHPLEQLEVVDLLRAVRNGARHFPEENNHVLDDPRLILRVNDGRQHLLLTKERYDVAIVDSTHPKSVDSWILYTREFFHLLRERLSPSGIVVQWLPLHGLSEREFMSVVATFQAAFPSMTLWASVGYETYGQVGYAKLVGTRDDGPMLIDVQRLEARLGLPEVQRDLARYGMGRGSEILDQFVAGPDRIRAWVRGIPTLSDDRPFLAYLSPLSAGQAMTPNRLLSVRESVRPYLRDVDTIDGAAMREIERAFEAQGLVISGQLESAMAHHPSGEKIRRYVEQTKTSRPYYTALAERYPEDTERLFEAGTQLGTLGHADVAEGIFERALQLQPNSVRLGLNAALLSLGAGRSRDATARLSRMTLRKPNVALLQQNLGAAWLAEGELGAARQALTRALRLDAHSVGALVTMADVEMATKNWSAARSLLRHALLLEPRSEGTLERLAKVSEALEDKSAALRYSEAAWQVDPYRSSFALDWSKRLAPSRPDLATTILDDAIHLHPEEARLRVMRGELSLGLGRWLDASSAFVVALEIDPNSADAALGLGQALLQLRRKSEAKSALCLAEKLGAPRPRIVALLDSLGERYENCANASRPN